MTMVVMLGVVGMLILRARDPRTWRWFANDNEKVSPATLKAFDKANGKKRQAVKYASGQKSGESLTLALAPATLDSDQAGPSKQAPPPAGPSERESPPPAVKQAPLADDVPPPEPAAVPQADKSEKAVKTPAAATDSANSRPASPLGVGPSPEALTADLPPPQPATDPDYLRKITESENLPQSGAASSTRGPANGGAATSSSGSSSGPSTSQPFEASTEAAGPKGSADAKPEMAKEELAVDEDPVERKDFEFECQAIDDKDVLRPEEMAAYWRLVRWTQEQTYKEMNNRARPGLTFSHFFEHPSRYRGQLVRLKIRVTRATAHDTEENGNGLGVERVYDLWGCTDESSPNPYALAITELPGDFPLGHDIQEDVTFVGYFFKLLAYKAHDDKTRAAPMLIGRVVWHPIVLPVSPVNTNFVWIGLIGGLVAVMLVVRLTFNMRPLRRPSRLPPLTEGEEGIPIETWLERVEGEPGVGEKPPEAINHHPNGDKQTNGAGQVFPQSLDHTEDQER
jgi:hypothetical protein